MKLTPREIEILGFLVRGYSNKQIAQSLHISHRTVEDHRSHILMAHKVKSLQALFWQLAQKGQCPVCGRGEHASH